MEQKSVGRGGVRRRERFIKTGYQIVVMIILGGEMMTSEEQAVNQQLIKVNLRLYHC